MAEIRLSFAGERFHLEREMIALIEVAFITLCVEDEAEAAPCRRRRRSGWRMEEVAHEENCKPAATIGIIRHEIRNFSG